MRWSPNTDENPELRELLRASNSAEFSRYAQLIEAGIEYVFDKRGQTLRTLALARILNDASEELRALSSDDWSRKSIRDMAWAARNLLELVLRYEYIQNSDENLRRLLDEQLRDETDIYESMKVLSDMPGDAEWCDEQIQHIHQTAVTNGYKVPKKPLQVAEIARAVGMEDEYRAVYKMYSKWVHPSSWRLFSGGRRQEFIAGMARMLLVGRAKGYAIRLLDLLSEDVAHEVDADGEAVLRPYDEVIGELDELDEEPATLLDLGSRETMRSLRDDMRALGIPDPPKPTDSWKRRRLL